ncbi:2-dehydropantoate 2-reductase [Candidatus Deferrimicrobium sp.]|uniref:2-dehydropantoate 2-reductase n=1 Tax=Candidatus Deferrimicrobium sp. TaxID=3060586 RepID=UPI002ED7AA4E
MKVAIVGAGGVGGYFGGRLAQAGDDVVFIARGEHLRAMRRKGLQVDSINGDFRVDRVLATDDPATVGEVDYVLVAVKSWQLRDAIETMRPMVGKTTSIVPLLNGVDAPDQLTNVFGAERVLGGTCSVISMIAGPGHVRHAGALPTIRFGELDRRRSERVERLRNAFSRTEGVRVEVPEDIHVVMWNKFMAIAPWSGIGAVTRAPIGVIRSLPETRALLEHAMEEISLLARARKIAMEREAIRQAMAFIDTLPFEGTASMQRDIMAGRPSELDAQNGTVVRLGKEAGVATPVNGMIYSSLLPLERRARKEVNFD